MNEVFDPEKVIRYTQDNVIMYPDISFGQMGWVQAADYDKLLALYRESIATHQAMDRKSHMKTQARKSKAISKAWSV